jgi:KDO2-lipid IV(A) lauroyltransferase
MPSANFIQRPSKHSMMKPLFDSGVARLALGFRWLARLFSYEVISDFSAVVTRTLGSLLRENQIGRANLTAAFPEKSAEEIDAILRGVWENLGRVGTDYVFLDKLWDFASTRLAYTPRARACLDNLRAGGKPAVMFGAHIGSWELGAIAFAANGQTLNLLYRPVKNRSIHEVVHGMRSQNMGRMVLGNSSAPLHLRSLLKGGGHFAMMADQHISTGVDVTFFGRRCKANPLVARLARQFDCRIFGGRVIRLPGHRFEIDFTDELAPPRDATGKIDVEATTQMITSVIEGWVREHPEQWLWIHRRWR